jgi:hypothetical protein
MATRRGEIEAVATRLTLDAGPWEVWSHVQFFEEIGARPPLLLRALLPRPLYAEGDKGHVGATVRCLYDKGHLLKRVTHVDAPRALHLEVIEQKLGIERWVDTVGGSYRLSATRGGTEVTLTTSYTSRLRPRGLWRRLEAYLVTRLHEHILRGVDRGLRLARAAEQFPGGIECTASPSTSRR